MIFFTQLNLKDNRVKDSVTRLVSMWQLGVTWILPFLFIYNEYVQKN